MNDKISVSQHGLIFSPIQESESLEILSSMVLMQVNLHGIQVIMIFNSLSSLSNQLLVFLMSDGVKYPVPLG